MYFPRAFRSKHAGVMMRALALPALLAAALAAAPEALAQKVFVDFDENFDFSTLRRYSWKTHPKLEENPALLQSVGAELVRMAVNDHLMQAGYEPIDPEFADFPGGADFYVTFFGGREQKQEVTAVTSTYSTGGWYGWGSPHFANGWTNVMVKDYVEGTLVLDFVDVKTKQLVWRAYCKGAIKNPSKRDKVINKALKKAFKKFPPKK